MHLSEVNVALDHKIVEGAEYQWACYGPNARFITYESDYACAEVVIDRKNQLVYEATISLKDDNQPVDRPYRWINPDYRLVVSVEAITRGVDNKIAWDNVEWIELEVAEDWLEKAKAMFNGSRPDSRVVVPLDLSDKELLHLALEAHKRDMTLNKFVEHLLELAIAKEL
jgi:hypothetical protein